MEPLRVTSERSAATQASDSLSESEANNQRVVVFAPTPQDAHLCRDILQQNGIDVYCCDTMTSLCESIGEGAGMALIAQEYLNEVAITMLKQTLNQQPKWSELPLLVLLQAGDIGSRTLQQIMSLEHVTLINRPLRIAVFITTIHAKLRDRRRQFEVRDLLNEKDQNQQRIRREAKRLNMALQAGGMAAWEWNNRKVFWSKSMPMLLGYEANIEPSETLLFAHIHDEDRDRIRREWTEAINADEAFRSQFRIMHPTLGERWLEAVGEPVKSKSDKTLSYAGLHWDITLQKQQTIELKKANAAKSEFLANMSHEIRTPMTAILGYTQILEEFIDHNEARGHLETIRRNGAFLLGIINDILDLSKIEAGKLEITSERFPPHRLVEDVRSIMEVRAKEDGLPLNVRYRGKIPIIINSDSKRLKQILVNLVGNAIKFTKEGQVEIVVEYLPDPPASLKFSVLDSGIGMSAKQQEKLFQPFSQGDASVTREFGGTGLGLVISRRLAEKLGGEITVESELGSGSTFALTIAVGDISGVECVNPKRTSQPAEEKTASNSPLRLDCNILLVDDRRDVRFLSSHILSKAGAAITEAADGLLAIEAVEKAESNGHEFDLILLDMQMPNLDGYATAKKLRQMGFAKPIIALTADAMQGDMKRCLECGCNDYLSKPIDVHQLLQKVQKFTS